MANLLNNDYLRCRIYNENPSRGQVAINTLYYKVVNIVGVWTPVDLATAFSQTHAPLFRGWQSSSTRYAGTGISRYSPLPTPEFKSTAGNGVGTLGGSSYPTQVTGLIGGKAADYHTGSATAKHPLGVQVLASMRLYISFPCAFLTPTPAETGAMAETLYQQLLLIAGTLLQQRTAFNVGGATITLAPQIRWSTVTLPPTVVRTFSFSPLETRYTSRLWATQQRRGDRGQHEAFSI